MLGYNEDMKPNKLDHLSPSSIAQFLRCAHQWKLERVDGIPREGSMALVGGLAWHEVSAANFLQKIETGNDLSEHELRKLFEKYFQKKLDESRIYVPPGESLKDLIARESGKHPIENNEIRNLPAHRTEGFRPCRRSLDPVPFPGELIGDEGRDVRFVLDDQDTLSPLRGWRIGFHVFLDHRQGVQGSSLPTVEPSRPHIKKNRAVT